VKPVHMTQPTSPLEAKDPSDRDLQTRWWPQLGGATTTPHSVKAQPANPLEAKSPSAQGSCGGAPSRTRGLLVRKPARITQPVNLLEAENPSVQDSREVRADRVCALPPPSGGLARTAFRDLVASLICGRSCSEREFSGEETGDLFVTSIRTLPTLILSSKSPLTCARTRRHLRSSAYATAVSGTE
jgi:hypothetical protein